jgi:hypothetical protein
MAMTLITTNTSSDAATSDFTTGIDSTYKLYVFKYYDVNPVTDNTAFTFNGSIDGGSNYNVTKTTTTFCAQHDEADTDTALTYRTDKDLAQDTGYQPLGFFVGNGADEGCAGTLWLFNPSNTIYVKHFYSRVNSYSGTDYSFDCFAAGYFNDTNDIDAIQFKMASGNMDAVIKMYGVG